MSKIIFSGRIPMPQGAYDATKAYTINNLVAMYGMSFLANGDVAAGYAPAQLNQDGTVSLINTDKWTLFAGDPSAYNMKQYFDDTVEQITALIANKANIDGWYSTLTVGAAENLVGRGTTPAVISFRPAGGTQDIGTGAASIAKLKGRTDAWNQGVRNAQFDAVGNWNSTSATFSVSGGKGTFTASAQNGGIYQNNVLPKVAGHKVFVAVTLKTTAAVNEIDVYMYGGYAILRNVAASGYQTISGYITTNASWGADLNNNHIIIRDRRTAGWDAVEVASVVAIDLTLEYTAGREPATAAAFLAEYSEALTAPYNAGKLINNKVTALVTDGFNQFDESTMEVGKYLYSDSGNISTDYPDRRASEIYFPCFGGQYYYLYGEGTSQYLVNVCWYDINKVFISSSFGMANSAVAAPSNAYFFRVCSASKTAPIAINLSHSGIRNGEYEPYWKSTLNIVHSKIYGKLNGAGEMVQIAPNGFRGVGSNYDEVDIVRKEAYIRRAWVDMGTLSYYVVTAGSGVFQCNKPGAAAAGSNKIICSKYSYLPDLGYSVTEKNISDSTSSSYTRIWMMRDAALANKTATEIKAALSGEYIDYPLATPLHYTDLMYSEDGGQTFIEIPAGYRVDDFGTERRLPDGIVDGAPASTPLVADIAYAMNAVDPLRNLPRNYLSKQSTENLLAAMQSAGIIAGYTMTYDEDNAEYDFTITAPAGA